MNEGLLNLISQYFQTDIFKHDLKQKTKDDVLELFSVFHKEKLTIKEIKERLTGNRKIVDLKYRLLFKAPRHSGPYKPLPLRLGELKLELQQEAYQKNISLSKYCKDILKDRKKD